MSEIREKLFNSLAKKEWKYLLELEKKYRDQILNDQQLKIIFEEYFLLEFFKYIKSVQNSLDRLVELRQFYSHFVQLYKNDIYTFSQENFEELVEYYLNQLMLNSDFKKALSISKGWEHLQTAKKILEEEMNKSLSELDHSNSRLISVTTNNHNKKANYSISLFKSEQEVNFFKAFIDTFPHHFTYPNVALSCLIDFSKIEILLTQKEKDYFFKAVVDCVVFDNTDDNYIPKYFFELDSIYHDSDKQKLKDEMKDKIFTSAGLNLFRIRAKDNQKPSRKEFQDLIKDIIK